MIPLTVPSPQSHFCIILSLLCQFANKRHVGAVTSGAFLKSCRLFFFASSVHFILHIWSCQPRHMVGTAASGSYCFWCCKFEFIHFGVFPHRDVTFHRCVFRQFIPHCQLWGLERQKMCCDQNSGFQLNSDAFAEGKNGACGAENEWC